MSTNPASGTSSAPSSAVPQTVSGSSAGSPLITPTPPAGQQPAGAGSQAPPGATPGAYTFKQTEADEPFNLGLAPSHPHPVPTDQAKLAKDVYETKNILKLLKDENRLSNEAYGELIRRVVEAATAGCVGPDVETGLAADALEQIRADILRRIGRPLAFRYLGFLALWGLAGVCIGLAIAAGQFVDKIPLLKSIGPFGWVIVGATAGTWFSVATRRWQIAFEEIPGFLDTVNEPIIRIVFAAIVALALALFLALGVLTIKLGSVDLAGFACGSDRCVEIALLLGFIAGTSERAVSKKLIDQVGKALPQS